jgi:hypothetical protein
VTKFYSRSSLFESLHCSHRLVVYRAARFEDDVVIYYAAWASSIAQASATLATVSHLRDLLQQQLTWLGEDEPAGARPGTDRRRQFRERVKEALLVLKQHGHDVLQQWAFRSGVFFTFF